MSEKFSSKILKEIQRRKVPQKFTENTLEPLEVTLLGSIFNPMQKGMFLLNLEKIGKKGPLERR